MGQRGFEPQSKRPKRSRMDQATLLSRPGGLDASMVFNSISDPGAPRSRRWRRLLPAPLDPPDEVEGGEAPEEGEEPELDEADEDGDGGGIVDRDPDGGEEGGHQDLDEADPARKAEGQGLKDDDDGVDG